MKENLSLSDFAQPTDCAAEDQSTAVEQQYTDHSPPHGSSSSCRHSPGTSCDDLFACAAAPDANSRPLHGVLQIKRRSTIPSTPNSPSLTHLSAESAGVLGVLRDFHLLHLLTERSTITLEIHSSFSSLCPLAKSSCKTHGTVLSGDADFLGALGLWVTFSIPS